MAARSTRPIAGTPVLAGRLPSLLRRPMRSNSISSCPRTTCQGSACGNSATRPRRVDSSFRTPFAASENNRSSSTSQVASSMKRATGREATLGSICRAAHMRRPKAKPRWSRARRMSSPASCLNRSIFSRSPNSANTESNAEDRHSRHSRSWASVVTMFGEGTGLPAKWSWLLSMSPRTPSNSISSKRSRPPTTLFLPLPSTSRQLP